MLISVCVITYKREKGLKLLLKGLNKLTFTKIERPGIEVIVVDNDSAGIAKKVCAEIEPEFQWTLKTDVEPQRGITYARNKSISLTSENSDFIVIVDDDEIPEKNWLEELLVAQQEHGAAIVTGPAVPIFEDNHAPEWILNCGYFEAPRYQDGEEKEVAFTNNVMIKADILRELNPVFDHRFALSGGSDSYLFLNLTKAGHKIVWADNAVVYDDIPASRTKLKWILFRSYRMWSNYSAFEMELYPSIATQFIRLLKGFALIFIGIFRLIPSLVMGKAFIAKSLISISQGMGTLGGLVGVFYQDYKHEVYTE